MHLDCRSHEFEYFPFNPKGYRLMFINSCAKRKLVGSSYNDRHKSCESVVRYITAEYPNEKFETLCDYT